MADINQLNAALRVLKQNYPGVTFEPTGSVLINGNGKDLDFVAYSGNVARLRGQLELDGFKRCVGEGYDEDFFAYRKNLINVIIEPLIENFRRWGVATNVCRFLSDGKMSKPVRVAIFKLIREGCSLEEMHGDIMDRFGGYADEPLVAQVDEMALRPDVPLPVQQD